jgi:hypothetical protein
MNHHQISLFLFVRGMTTVFFVGGLGVEWPRRNPSLTVCGFFLWNWAKEKACRSQPRTLAEVEQKNLPHTGVLISPWPDLLPDVFCFMVRIFLLMLVLLYI